MVHWDWFSIILFCGNREKDDEMVKMVRALESSGKSVNVGRKTLAEILTGTERRLMTGKHWIVRQVTVETLTSRGNANHPASYGEPFIALELGCSPSIQWCGRTDSHQVDCFWHPAAAYDDRLVLLI